MLKGDNIQDFTFVRTDGQGFCFRGFRSRWEKGVGFKSTNIDMFEFLSWSAGVRAKQFKSFLKKLLTKCFKGFIIV